MIIDGVDTEETWPISMAGVDAQVRVLPGVVMGDLMSVEMLSGVHTDTDGGLPNPSEWAVKAGDDYGPPDMFSTAIHEMIRPLNKTDVAVATATAMTEAFVHEVMEWLAVDGQRVFNAHPKKGDHWNWVAEQIRDFYTGLLEQWPDPKFTDFPKVDIYRNLRTGTWSKREKGKVTGHPERAIVSNATLVVQPGGRQRVLDEGRKNVHAFVRGELVAEEPPGDWHEGDPFWRQATYNPYKNSSFVDTETRKPVKEARVVYLDEDHKVHYRQ